MTNRKGWFVLDECFDEICTSKCSKYPSIYVGSLDCHKCKEFVKEERGVGFEATITCKS